MKRSGCYLFTNFSPYGDTEVFLKSELPYLSSKFNKVVVFSFFDHSKKRNELPENIRVVVLPHETAERKSSMGLIFENLFLWLRILIPELISNGFISFNNVRTKNAELINQFRNAYILRNYLKTHKGVDEEVVYYSYWFDRWTTILGILKAKGFIKRFITRAHAFDLYEDYLPEKHIPFRNFQLKSVDKVYSVSKDGKHYLQGKYPQYSHKFEVTLLGTKPILNSNKGNETNIFTIVSCGSVQARKRTVEIPFVLKKLSFNFKWVHFGDGPDFEKLKTIIGDLGLSNQVELKGFIKNSQFISFLQEKNPNVFISLSENEGIPYSIMESISLGIPVIATDAGGCREICTSQTGVLLPLEINHDAIALALENFKNSEMNTAKFKIQVKQFWESNFNADNNFNDFTKILNQYKE